VSVVFSGDVLAIGFRDGLPRKHVSATAATPPGNPDGWSDGYVYANGIGIHYYHAIRAPGLPVLVMAHGATDIGLSWTTKERYHLMEDNLSQPVDPETAA
jgi:hypothetical protein